MIWNMWRHKVDRKVDRMDQEVQEAKGQYYELWRLLSELTVRTGHILKHHPSKKEHWTVEKKEIK